MKPLHLMASTLGLVGALTGCATQSADLATPMLSTAMTLTSSAFTDGGVLDKRYAGNLKQNPNCVGENVSPPLTWTNVPAGTKSFAFVVYDPDGSNGLGVVHWVAYGIPATVSGFAENEVTAMGSKYVDGKSSLNLGSYMGPCPPAGSGWHHYNYTVIATDLELNALPPGLTRDELFVSLAGHAKVSATRVGRYGR